MRIYISPYSRRLDPRNPENSGLLSSMINRNAQRQNADIACKYFMRSMRELTLGCVECLSHVWGKKGQRSRELIGVIRAQCSAVHPAAVASLWSVDDEATSELMKDFYSNMLAEKHDSAPQP
jgi:CHAT domain-containing protein